MAGHWHAKAWHASHWQDHHWIQEITVEPPPTPSRRGAPIWGRLRRPLPPAEPLAPLVLWDAHRRGTATLVLSSESRAVWRWRRRRTLPAEMPVAPAARVRVDAAEVWEWRHGPVRSIGAGLVASRTSATYYPGEPLWLGLDLEEEEVLQ